MILKIMKIKKELSTSELKLSMLRFLKKEEANLSIGYSLTSSHKWGPSLLCLQ